MEYTFEVILVSGALTRKVGSISLLDVRSREETLPSKNCGGK